MSVYCGEIIRNAQATKTRYAFIHAGYMDYSGTLATALSSFRQPHENYPQAQFLLALCFYHLKYTNKYLLLGLC